MEAEQTGQNPVKAWALVTGAPGKTRAAKLHMQVIPSIGQKSRFPQLFSDQSCTAAAKRAFRN